MRGRFTFHRPADAVRGTAPALVEVRDGGKPIGLVNRHRDGYVLRALDGRKLDTTYGIDRVTSAGVLAQLVRWDDEPVDAEREAQELLAATPAAELLTKSHQLTHKMHELDAKVEAGTRRRGDYVVSVETSRASTALHDARAQRNLIDAELLRRCGETA